MRTITLSGCTVCGGITDAEQQARVLEGYPIYWCDCKSKTDVWSIKTADGYLCDGTLDILLFDTADAAHHYIQKHKIDGVPEKEEEMRLKHL